MRTAALAARARQRANGAALLGPVRLGLRCPGIPFCTALDATDCRALAEFYRRFLGLRYRPGDEIPTDGSDDE